MALGGDSNAKLGGETCWACYFEGWHTLVTALTHLYFTSIDSILIIVKIVLIQGFSLLIEMAINVIGLVIMMMRATCFSLESHPVTMWSN